MLELGGPLEVNFLLNTVSALVYVQTCTQSGQARIGKSVLPQLAVVCLPGIQPNCPGLSVLNPEVAITALPSSKENLRPYVIK